MTAPATASRDDTPINGRHGTPAASQASMCGNADPSVSAPTTIPNAAPRRSRNHPAAIFRPGGYTQASASPVPNLSAMMVPGVLANAIDPLAIAPATHPIANSRRALSTSARFNVALNSVPTTNPACTAIVSQAIVDEEIESSLAMEGAAAVAENQRVMPSNWAAATRKSMRCGIGGYYQGEGEAQLTGEREKGRRQELISLSPLLQLSASPVLSLTWYDLPVPPLNIAYTRHTLPNGLDILIHEDHNCPIVAVNIWYHVGSKNEKPGRT